MPNTTLSWVSPCGLSRVLFVLTQAVCHLSVVGQDELDNRSVNVRNRDDVGTKARGQILPLQEVSDKLVALKKSRSLDNKL